MLARVWLAFALIHLFATPAYGPGVGYPPPPPPKPDRSIECVALAVYHEARGEPLAGQFQVAFVIVERTRRASWPHDVCAVAEQARQFSWRYLPGHDRPPAEREAWAVAHEVARQAVLGLVVDGMHATCYDSAPHRWGKFLGRIGRHLFYDCEGQR